MMELRERILDAALESFLSVGYAATTADAVAKKLQISKKTLYKVIPSKELLLRDCVEHLIKQIDEGLTQVYTDQNMAFHDRVESHMSYVMRQYQRLGSSAAMADLRRASPDSWKMFDEFADQRRRSFKDMLEAGVREGHLSTEFPVDLMVRVYAAFMDHFVQFAATLGEGISPATLYLGFMEMFYHGILITPTSRGDA